MRRRCAVPSAFQFLRLPRTPLQSICGAPVLSISPGDFAEHTMRTGPSNAGRRAFDGAGAGHELASSGRRCRTSGHDPAALSTDDELSRLSRSRSTTLTVNLAILRLRPAALSVRRGCRAHTVY